MSSRGRGSKAHIHKYHYINIKYTSVWACALGDCTHFMPAHLETMMLGKKSLCWACNGEFYLDEDNMKNSEPICYECAHANVIAHLTNKV
jgi:hypothetical protein